MKTNPALSLLDAAVGRWTVTGSHPYLPGLALSGCVSFERIEGGAFLRMHSRMDQTEIPEGVAIFGTDSDEETCTMLYFDERGVGRRYDVTFHEDGFSWTRDAKAFAQRFRITIAKDGRAMRGEGMMKKEGSEWESDLQLSYARAG
jgi:hypothetical protein